MRPYFPFLMGNGIDSVLIDYSGSMSCDSGHLHTEQHQNAVCAWYKIYHRTNKEVLSPIIKSYYTLYANGGETYEVGRYQQTFNPDTAILTTHIEAHEGLEVCKSDWGLSNPGTYRNLVWPWNDCLAAWALSYMKDPRAYERLANAVKYTSQIGAFCEKIRPDRFWIGFHYVTCHGSYVSAVNAFLCHTRHDKLRILPGIPNGWKDLEIDNLRVQGGLCIKLKLQDRIITELILINDTKIQTNYTLEIPSDLLDDFNRNKVGMRVAIPAGSKMQVI